MRVPRRIAQKKSLLVVTSLPGIEDSPQRHRDTKKTLCPIKKGLLCVLRVSVVTSLALREAAR